MGSLKARLDKLGRELRLGEPWDGISDVEFINLEPFAGAIDPDAHPGAFRRQTMMGAVCALHDILEPIRLRAVQIEPDAEVEDSAAYGREMAGAGPDDEPDRCLECLLDRCREVGFNDAEIAEARKFLVGELRRADPWAAT